MTSWDERYRGGEASGRGPSPLLVHAVASLAPGRALDLACGLGRHALFLGQQGWSVTAVDSSHVAMELLARQAAERGLRIDARVANLEAGEFAIAPGAYELICDFFYLQRDLFPRIRAGLQEAGRFVAAIPLVDDTPGVKPMNPKFLLQPGELRELFDAWKILHYSEDRPAGGEQQRRVAEIIAQRP